MGVFGVRDISSQGLCLMGTQKPQVVAGTENSHYSLEYFALKRLHPRVLQKIPNIYLTVGGWLSYFERNFKTTLLGGKR